MSNNSVGLAIIHVRKSRGLSQSEVERRAGITRNYLYRVECGDLVPSLRNLGRLARALDLETWKLVRLIGQIEESSPYNSVNRIAPGQPVPHS